MKKASDPVCGIREGFLEEVMFKVKPVFLRPREKRNRPTVPYHLILHTQPPPSALPLPDHGKSVLLFIALLQTTLNLEASHNHPSLCCMSVLVKNWSRARLRASSARCGVDGGHSVSTSGEWVGLEGPGWCRFSVMGHLAGEDGGLVSAGTVD